MKRLAGAVGLVIAIYFDSIFFARLNVFGIRPDVLLAVTISYAVHTGRLSGAVFGAVGGLFMDLFFGRMLGLNGAVYLTAGLCAGFFYQKFYADNIIIPGATALVASVGKDIIFALVTSLMGARFHLGWILVQYILPSAVFTSAICLIVHLAFKPLVGRQIGGRGRGFER